MKIEEVIEKIKELIRTGNYIVDTRNDEKYLSSTKVLEILSQVKLQELKLNKEEVHIIILMLDTFLQQDDFRKTSKDIMSIIKAKLSNG